MVLLSHLLRGALRRSGLADSAGHHASRG
jgi:hypothetical protein